MPDMRETLKYTFTVEGETEQWYLLWLRDQINACPDREKNISIVPKVQQSPAKFYKSTSRKVTPVARNDDPGNHRESDLQGHTEIWR